MDVKQITDILFEKGDIEDKYLKKIIESEESMEYLFKKADEKRREALLRFQVIAKTTVSIAE